MDLNTISNPAIPLSVFTDKEEGEMNEEEYDPEIMDLTNSPSSKDEEKEERKGLGIQVKQEKEERLDSIQVKEEKLEPRESWSPRSASSGKRTNREEGSPEHQPERKTRREDYWERLNKDSHYNALTACRSETRITVSDEEVRLIDWHHEIGEDVKLHELRIAQKKQYVKVFKIWRQTKKSRPVNENLVRAFEGSEQQRENMRTSWESFLKKCAAGNIEEDIERRARGKSTHSLSICRQKVHEECTKESSKIPCYVKYKEEYCSLCDYEQTSLENPRQLARITRFPSEQDWDYDQADAIYRYEQALKQKRQAGVERYTRREYQEYPDEEKDVVPTYLAPEGNPPSGRERSRQGNEYYYYDRVEPDQERYTQSDRRSSQAGPLRQYDGRLSYRQSIDYLPRSPQGARGRDDWETRELVSNRIDRMKDDLHQQSLAAVTAREKMSQRISDIERSSFGLADKTMNLDKKVDATRECWKKVASELKHEQQRLESLQTEVSGFQLVAEATRHLPVKVMEQERQVKQLQKMLEEKDQQLARVLKRLDEQSQLIERIVSRVFSETKKEDPKESDQKPSTDLESALEEKSGMP